MNENVSMNRYSLFVGGSEVNSYYQTYDDIVDIASDYEDDGYDDIDIVLIYKEVHYFKNNTFYYIDDDNEWIEVETLDTIDNKYYFCLFCEQNDNNMVIGSNTRTIKQLLDEYWDYKSNDLADENDSMDYYTKKLTIEQQLQFMFDDEFELHLYTDKVMEW